MACAKKLSLDEFLKSSSLFFEEPTEFKEPSRRSLIEAKSSTGYSIYDFIKALVNHKGIFLVEGERFTEFSYNDFNVFFFSEDFARTSMILYDPIINIERDSNNYTITYYLNKHVAVSLMKD